MTIIRYIHMFLAFSIEMAMLAAYGRWGYLQGKSTMMKFLFATFIVGAAITIWAFFCAPKADYRLSFIPRLLVELIMFLLAAFLLHKTGATTLAMTFACLACVSILLAFILKQ